MWSIILSYRREERDHRMHRSKEDESRDGVEVASVPRTDVDYGMGIPGASAVVSDGRGSVSGAHGHYRPRTWRI